MASYQVMCSVTRPAEPVALCHVDQFPAKINRHMGSVLHDVMLTAGEMDHSSGGSSHTLQLGGGVDDGGGTCKGAQSRADSLLCALISKSSVTFSGEDNFAAMKMPFFWCDLCPFDTESKASLLNHIVTNHLFVCRFCSYVALSRCDVVQHGLSQHPQAFQQFRDQKLKGCFLKRQLFQQHFQPESTLLNSPQIPNMHVEELAATEPPQDTEEGEHNTDHNINLDSEKLRGYSSGSDSYDEEMIIHFQERVSTSQEQNFLQSSALPDAGDGCMESVGENVVSSSGMEPESGVSANESTSANTVDSLSITTVSLSPSQEKIYAPVASKSPETFSNFNSLSDSLSLPSTLPVKTEKNSDMEGFCLALGKTLPERQLDDRTLTTGGSNSSFVPVIKGEALVDLTLKCLPSDIRNSQQNSCCRHTAHSPLTTICPNILQRQFEESFQIQSSESSLETVEGLSATKNSQPKGKVTSPGFVDNFLLDSTLSKAIKPAGSGESSSSVLRTLLTRPRLQSQNHAETQVRAVSEGPDGLKGERVINSSKAADNFLLSPLLHKNKILQRKSPEKEEAWEEFPAPFIKQEPIDEDNASMHTFASQFCGVVLEGSKNQKSGLSANILQRKPNCPTSESQRQEATALTPRITSEKLKTYSNMSLRDILTMNTDVDFVIPLTVSKETSSSAAQEQKVCLDDDSNAVPRRDNFAAQISGVMWECGYCDFTARHRSIVMLHRQQMHSKLMEEAGFAKLDEEPREEEEEEDRVGDWENPGAEEEKEEECWRGRQSTSTTRSQGSTLAQDLSIHRSRKHVISVRSDEDYEYMSAESLAESHSDDDLTDDSKDKNYEPPKHLSLADSQSSEDELPQRSSSISIQKRGRPTALTSHSKELFDLLSRASLVSSQRKKRGRPLGSKKSLSIILTRGQPQGVVEPHEKMYHCPYCSLSQPSLQGLKNHILHVSTSREMKNKDVAPRERHLLMVSKVTGGHITSASHQKRQRGQLHYLCPNDHCLEVFPEFSSWVYLSHVLDCQGHILDAQESSARSLAAKFLKEAVDNAAGCFISCPVDMCFFVTPSREQMDSHLGVHIQHIHASQYLLFSSVCSAMTRMFGKIEGFDSFICYRCASIVANLSAAVEHMRKKHCGQVRGVLRIFQKHDKVCRLNMVSVYCLCCLQAVSSLNHWFIHRCPASSGESSRDSSVPAYSCSQIIPALDSWVWRIQYKVSDPLPATSQHQVDHSAASEQGTVKLPLIRSILEHAGAVSTKEMAEPPEQRCVEAENDEVMPVVQCQECDVFVPESQWKQHGCNIKVRKTKCDQGPDAKVPSETGKLAFEATGYKLIGEGKETHHSRLLSALASRHQSYALGCTTSSGSPKAGSSQASISTPSSLLSILTSPRTSNSLSYQPLPHTSTKGGAPKPQNSPPAKEIIGSTIRSLLTGPVFNDLDKVRPLAGRKRLNDDRQGPQRNLPVQGLVLSDSQSTSLPHLKNLASVLSEPVHQRLASSFRDRDFNDVPLMMSSKRRRSGEEAGTDDKVSLPEVDHQHGAGCSQTLAPLHGQSQAPASHLLHGLAVDVSNKGQKNKSNAASLSEGANSQGLLMTFLHQQGTQMRQVLGKVLDDPPENA